MAKKKNYHELLKTPFDTGIGHFTDIAKYYLYYAPSIDSAQTVGQLNDLEADSILQTMIAQSYIDKKKARFLKKVQPTSWVTIDLSEDELDFEIPRFICDKYSNENDLHALLRHIRNAFAHGYLYVWKKQSGNYIFLIDFDPGKKKPTAKIMISFSILQQWKNILEAKVAMLHENEQ